MTPGSGVGSRHTPGGPNRILGKKIPLSWGLRFFPLFVSPRRQADSRRGHFGLLGVQKEFFFRRPPATPEVPRVVRTPPDPGVVRSHEQIGRQPLDESERVRVQRFLWCCYLTKLPAYEDTVLGDCSILSQLYKQNPKIHSLRFGSGDACGASSRLRRTERGAGGYHTTTLV
jgi:hypothetical protein